MIDVTRPGRAGLILSLTSVVFAATCAIAFAAHPKKGAIYSGEISRTKTVKLPISFKVSKNGKQVTAFTFTSDYPVYCQGGGFGSPQSRSAKVSRKGTFKVKLPLVFAPTHQDQGNLVITGKFGRHGTESGKLTTDFTTSPTCNGTSKYATRAS